MFLTVFTGERYASLLRFSLAILRAVLRLCNFGWFDAIRLSTLSTVDCFHLKHRGRHEFPIEAAVRTHALPPIRLIEERCVPDFASIFPHLNGEVINLVKFDSTDSKPP